MSRGEIAVLAGSAIAVGVTAWWAITFTHSFEATMSWHGVIALVLGVGISLALGVGLMNLAYRATARATTTRPTTPTSDTDLPPRRLSVYFLSVRM